MKTSYPHHAELGQVPDTRYFRNIRRFPNLIIADGLLIYRFDASLFFANANTFKNVLLDYKSQRSDPLHTILLDMESINSIDTSALRILEQIIQENEVGKD
jgi:SulP family sulfate permease